jgi:hypothetical protein
MHGLARNRRAQGDEFQRRRHGNTRRCRQLLIPDNIVRDGVQVISVVGVRDSEAVRDFCNQIIASRQDGDGRIIDAALAQNVKRDGDRAMDCCSELILVVVG